MKIGGIGKITLHLSEECGSKDITLSEVLYVPDLEDNLISQGQIEERGLKITAYQGVARVSIGEKTIIKAHRISRMYYVTTVNGVTISEIRKECKTYHEKKANKVASYTWHCRLGHPSDDTLVKLDVLEGCFQKKDAEKNNCIACIQGKKKREKFPCSKGEKASRVLARIHSDII